MESDPNPRSTVAWSGLDLRTGIEGGAQAARTAVRESVWRPDGGHGRRYELLALASRVRPAAFLSGLELDGDTTVEDSLTKVCWHNDLRVTWSTLYRFVAETTPAVEQPYAVYVLGVNPPADLDETERTEFDDFYTNVHMPEVAERRGALRAARYELVRELRAPARGAPHFLTVYEVDEAGSEHRKHTGPPYQRGPEVWQRHTTPWRFWYRTLGG